RPPSEPFSFLKRATRCIIWSRVQFRMRRQSFMAVLLDPLCYGAAYSQAPGEILLRLRSHLVVLVVAAVVPLLVFAGLIVQQDLAERREVVDRGMQDTVRALSLAVDGEVKASVAVLQTLAASPFLDVADLRGFHHVSARA